MKNTILKILILTLQLTIIVLINIVSENKAVANLPQPGNGFNLGQPTTGGEFDSGHPPHGDVGLDPETEGAPIPPSATYLFKVTNNSVEVSFFDRSGAEEGHNIYRRTANSWWGPSSRVFTLDPIKDKGGRGVWVDEDLQSNTFYCYRIGTFKTSNIGSYQQTYSPETCTTTLNYDPANAIEGGGFKDGLASVLEHIDVELKWWTTVTFETKNCTDGANPVLHLLSNGIQKKMDDNGGVGVNAKLSYVPIEFGFSSRKYKLLVRAKNNDSTGYCDIYQDGVLVRSKSSLGGWRITLPGLRKNEEIESVMLPNGVDESHFFYLLEGDNIIGRRYESGGTAGASLYIVSDDFLTRDLIIGLPLNSLPGVIRIVRNDVNLSEHDIDNDGLGRELEWELGTCTGTKTKPGLSTVGFDCSRAADMADTDGDGINDGWEVLGRRDKTPHQPLPRWGANPMHKDIFLEVDFMLRCPSQNPSNASERMMTENKARRMVQLYSDKIINNNGPVISKQSIQRLRSFQLRNPDGLPGINLHIDSGRVPQSISDMTLYGDWGGHNDVEAEENSNTECGFSGAEVSNVWRTQMELVRRGIFHYALAYKGGGGQTQENKIFSSWAMDDELNPAHELAHSLGLGHSGPAGWRGAIDANCKPNYASIINYGYYDKWGSSQGITFSDGTRNVINNQHLQERSVVDPTDTRYLDHLENIFGYTVDRANGHVDWNRDGFYSTTPVRAYANHIMGGQGCEWTRYNGIKIKQTARTILSPAMGRLGNITYVFFSETGTSQRLGYVFSNSDFSCPQADAEGCNGAKFSLPQFNSELDASGGVTVAKIQLNGVQHLLVVSKDQNGQLWSSILSSSEQWSSPVKMPILIEGEPTLTSNGNTAYLVYREQQTNDIYTIRYNDADHWHAHFQAKYQGALSVAGLKMDSNVSPGLVYVHLPDSQIAPTPRLLGFFTNTSGEMEAWQKIINILPFQTNGLWQKVDIFETKLVNITGRPSIAWIPPGDRAKNGRLYMSYVNTNKELRLLMTYTKQINGTLKEQFGQDFPFDNSSRKGYGMALFHEAEIDENLRGVFSVISGNNTIDKTLFFKAHADGINGFDLEDVSDWDLFSVSLCRTLMRPNNRGVDSDIPNPVNCHLWKW